MIVGAWIQDSESLSRGFRVTGHQPRRYDSSSSDLHGVLPTMVGRELGLSRLTLLPISHWHPTGPKSILEKADFLSHYAEFSGLAYYHKG